MPIPGYVGHYEASDLGNVRSLDRLTSHGHRRRGQALRQSLSETGYLQVRLYRENVGRTFTVHRLVLLAFAGTAPEGTEARHLDGNSANNRLANLEWGVVIDNKRDTLRHGTHPQASKTHCPAGHPYDAENTYVYPDPTRPHRGCHACRRERARALAKARKAA